MNQRVRTGVLLAGGYGCYQAVSSSGYLTAMGTVSGNQDGYPVVLADRVQIV